MSQKETEEEDKRQDPTQISKASTKPNTISDKEMKKGSKKIETSKKEKSSSNKETPEPINTLLSESYRSQSLQLRNEQSNKLITTSLGLGKLNRPKKESFLQILRWQMEFLDKNFLLIQKLYVEPLKKQSKRPPMKNQILNDPGLMVKLDGTLVERDNKFRAELKKLSFDLSQDSAFYVPVQRQRWMSVGELSILSRLETLTQMVGSYSGMHAALIEVYTNHYDRFVQSTDNNCAQLMENFILGVRTGVTLTDLFELEPTKYDTQNSVIKEYVSEDWFTHKLNVNLTNKSLHIELEQTSQYIKNLELKVNYLRSVVNLIIKAAVDITDQMYALSNESKRVLQTHIILRKIHSKLPSKYYFVDTHEHYALFKTVLEAGPSNKRVVFPRTAE
uniref:DHC_N1 domain-containing protein n=1 Tax=Rhabditophanes sp. KR3021 TaxID=114890 RepID=A0AC35UEK8_9BILA